MSRIFVMPEELSNRIAAGEVIERPASVVKELVENAIDAGSTRISVRTEQAGSRLIRVSDNGAGMDAEDAILCLEPHGTSKLRKSEDMENIVTLGFRGEALPSIASVSHLTIETRQPDCVEGLRVEVHGGKRDSAVPAGCAPGTVITVRDLFYNVPARRKFLRSAPTEQQHIEETLLALALPQPEISFELVSDGRTVLQSPGDPRPEVRLRALFGKHFAEQMLPLDHREEGMHISGWIAAPGFNRPSRREQRLFVNRRAVESQALYRGVRDGYGSLADHGRFPPCILFIEMDPHEVDVNVHPAKREVRFRREFVISRAVATAIAGALRGPSARPQSELDPRIPMEPLLAGMRVRYTPHPETADLFPAPERPAPMPPVTVPVRTGTTDFPTYRKPEPQVMPSSRPAPEPEPQVMPSPRPAPEPEPQIMPSPRPAPEPEPLRPAPDVPVFNGDWPEKVLGIIQSTYIVAEGRSGLILIDQHAAHERIMFEKLLADAQKGVLKQPLLIPVTLHLPRPAAAMLLRTRDWFSELGFDVEDMGGGTVMLNAVPVSLRTADMEKLMLDTLSELAEENGARVPLEREHVARAACHAAVKAGDELTLDMAAELLKQLAACRRGMLCPHGRPTMITMTMNELARRFGRK